MIYFADKLKSQSSTSVLQNLEIATTAESVSPRLTPGDGLCKGSKALKGGVKKFIPTPKRFGEEEEEKSIKARSLISGSTRQGAVKMKPDVKEVSMKYSCFFFMGMCFGQVDIP